jgi:hypothetical protein
VEHAINNEVRECNFCVPELGQGCKVVAGKPVQDAIQAGSSVDLPALLSLDVEGV